MRNLKRALSLALASVMLLGMMVVGTSAASYTDVDENDNVEAIEVLNAVNVMIGRQGNFEPDEAVNRHEMAVIMAKLVLGVDTADSYVGSHPYTDVVPWADKYVAACYENGLVYGKSATTYNGNDPLTAVEAAAMMLRALGYKDLNKGYQGDWRAPITAMANQIRLFSGVASNPNEKLDRNQVAQLALNTLKSPMVNLKDNTISWTDGDGQIVISGGSRDYIVLSSREAYAYAINDVENQGNSAAGINGATVELGEHLYNGKLRLNNNDTDAFGRPARHWEYDGKAIGSYVKEELLRETYTKKVTGKDLYDLLTKSTIEDKSYNFRIYVDGEDRYSATNGINGVNTVFNTTQMNKDNKAGVGGTGKGVLTEVYVDSGKKEVTIAIINTYLARAKTDYNEKQDEVTLNVYGIDRAVAGSGAVYFWKNVSRSTDQKEPITVYGEDFAITNVEENDAYLVTVAEGEIQTMTPAEILSAVTLSAFGTDDFVITGGTQYDYASTAQYDVEVLDEYTGTSATNLKDLQYNVYLDKYGYLIGVDLVDDVNNYVFITGVDSKTSNLAAKNYEANAIFLDGTMKTITFNTEKSTLNTTSVLARGTKTTNDWALANTWCTYTVNNDGVYTLKQVALPAAAGGSAKDADNKTVSYGAGDSIVGLRTSAGNAVTKIGQYWDQHDGTGVAADTDSVSKDINVKRVSLRGSEGTADVRNDFKFVYGNKNTVYLNAEVKGIYTGAATSAPRGVISKVTSVTTGVENANLEVLSEAAASAQAKTKSTAQSVTPDANGTAYGSYVLYGRDGYVIAAVTVARDASATENLVYIDSSKVKREEYNGGSSKAAGDGMWTWYRDGVKDGERVTLTEVGDGLSILKSLAPNNWYVISYNAEGEVIGATHAVDDVDVFKNYTSSDKTLEKTMVDAGSKTVLYERAQYGNTADETTGCPGGHTAKDIYSNKGPVLKGNTFYSETEDKTGFFVDESVKVVIIQTNRNASTTQFLSGMSALENVVAKLNKHENDEKCNVVGCKDYHYEVSALIENGRGKVVIINDLHKTGDDGSYTGKVNTYTRNGIRFLINSDKAGDLDTTGRVDRYGDLTVFVPKAKARANWLPAEITVEVFVNDVFVDVAEYDSSKDTNRFYAYTLNDWALDTAEDDILVEVTWKDSTVKTPADVTLSGDKAGYTVKVNGAAYDATATYYVGDEVVVTPISGYTVTVTANGKTETISAKETYTLTAAGLTVSAVKDDVNTPITVKAGESFTMTGASATLVITDTGVAEGKDVLIKIGGDYFTQKADAAGSVSFVYEGTGSKTVTAYAAKKVLPYEGDPTYAIVTFVNGEETVGVDAAIVTRPGAAAPKAASARAAVVADNTESNVVELTFTGSVETVKLVKGSDGFYRGGWDQIPEDATGVKGVRRVKNPMNITMSVTDTADTTAITTDKAGVTASMAGIKLPKNMDVDGASAVLTWYKDGSETALPDYSYTEKDAKYFYTAVVTAAEGEPFKANVTVNGEPAKVGDNGSVSVKKDGTPAETPDADTYTLTLKGLMGQYADQIKIYVREGNGKEQDITRYIEVDHGRHEAKCSIPKEAKVSMHVPNTGETEWFTLGSSFTEADTVYWVVGPGGNANKKTVMKVERAVKELTPTVDEAILNFTMGQDVLMDLFEKDRMELGGHPALPVTVHKGVEIEAYKDTSTSFTPGPGNKIDLEDQAQIKGEDGITYFLPYDIDTTGGSFTKDCLKFKILENGADKAGTEAYYVIEGKQGVFDAPNKVGVYSKNNATYASTTGAYRPWRPLDFYPASPVKGVQVWFTNGVTGPSGDPNIVSSQECFVAVDEKLTFEHKYPTAANNNPSDKFMIVSNSDNTNKNFVRTTTQDDVIDSDEAWTVEAIRYTVRIYNAIDFTLGTGVQATLAKVDNRSAANGSDMFVAEPDAGGTGRTKIVSAPDKDTMFYMAAKENADKIIVGMNSLIFAAIKENDQAVVEPGKVGYYGDPCVEKEFKWITNRVLVGSEIGPKARYEAWTMITTGTTNNVDEAYIVTEHQVPGMVFDGLHGGVGGVGGWTKVHDTNLAYARTWSELARTVLIKSDIKAGDIKADGETVTAITVYAPGSKETQAVKKTVKGETTDLVEAAKDWWGVEDHNHVCGDLNIIGVGTDKITLSVGLITTP